MRFITLFLALVLSITFFTKVVSALDTSPTPTFTPTPGPSSDQVKQKEDEIKQLENKVKDLQAQGQTLSSQIAVIDNQVKLTQLRIDATQQQITGVEKDISTANKKIDNLESALNNLTKVLLNRIVVTYEVGSVQPFHVLLSSGNVADLFSRLNYLKVAQTHDKKLIYETQQARNDYTNQKKIFEDKKQKIETLKIQLESYTTQLASQKQSKQQLLADTEGSEAVYQRLLSQARTQLVAFGNFTSSQGGASILNNQTTCDDWGCYYNQRDSSWGSNSLNHTQYTLASDGCLVTSMAMVYTHYGHRGVTPQAINSNPDNFASYYPAWLKYTVTADGASSNRTRDSIDNTLSSGNPVVVGVSYDGGPIADHFVVLISGSNGNYKMNDPFTPNGHNMVFTDKYSVSGIREIYKVVF